MYFDLNRMEVVRYRPFPYAILRDAFDPEVYRGLAESFPPPTQMKLQEKMAVDGVAEKYVWRESKDAAPITEFLKKNKAWSELWKHLRSAEFINHTLEALREKGIDVTRLRAVPTTNWQRYWHASSGYSKQGAVAFSDYVARTSQTDLKAEIEFSALPGKNGGLPPHADSASKLVSFVVPFPLDREWQDDYGGGTSFVEPKDEHFYFNRLNRGLNFEDVDVFDTIPYRANQILVFIKTFNSWHAVFPTHAANAATWRKTITVNILKRNNKA